jgi:hypothetical protein
MTKETDDDVLRGIRAIARYTGESYRQAHWRVERGLYPVTRVGKIIETRKSIIDKIRTPQIA